MPEYSSDFQVAKYSILLKVSLSKQLLSIITVIYCKNGLAVKYHKFEVNRWEMSLQFINVT